MGATQVCGPVGSPTVQLFDGLSGLPALRQEWTELFSRGAYQPSLSFEWAEALACTQLQPDDRPFLLTLRQESCLVGVLPIFARRSRVFGAWHHIIRPLAELKNTHSDLLIEDLRPQVLAEVLRALRGLACPWDSLRISKVLEGHAAAPVLGDAASAAGFTCHARYARAAYWIPLPGSFDEYFAARSAKFRNHARRAEKKLRACGPLEVVEVTAGSEFEEGYAALLEIERASWKQQHGTAISAVPRQEALYREWGRRATAIGGPHLQLLMVGGQPIAYNLGAIHHGTYYYLKTSYAAAFRPAGPATFLRLRLIQSMIDRGLSAIDFCGTPYEWELQWTDQYRWHLVLSTYRDSWRGRIFSALDPWTHYSSAGKAVEHRDPRDQRPE